MDYQERSDQLEGEADKLEAEGQRVEEHVKETRQDWEAKKQDDQVPGAMEADTSEDEDPDEPPRSGDQAEAGQ